MYDVWAHQPPVDSRSLGNAEGVLIALCHCDRDAAFDELVSTANRRCIPLFALASAVVKLAGQGEADCNDASRAAQAEWPDLFQQATWSS